MLVQRWNNGGATQKGKVKKADVLVIIDNFGNEIEVVFENGILDVENISGKCVFQMYL